jgi:multidrug efflux system membrane fusion protein
MTLRRPASRVSAPRVLLLSALLVGCHRAPPPPAPDEAPPAAPVQVAQAKREPLGSWAELPGTTQPLPNRVARVTAVIEGRVAEVLPTSEGGATVVEGQQVTAGQVIVRLDDRIARANLAKADAAQKENEAGIRQAALAVELARVDLQSLQTLQASRPGNGDRGLELVPEVRLRKAQLAIDDAEAKMQAAEAKRATGEAERRAMATQLEQYTLRTPIAGRLGLLQVVSGQTLAVGALVAEVVDLGEFDVLSLVPPSRILKIALGQPARIVASEPPEAAPEGTVVFVAAQAQPETGCFAVKARFPNPKARWPANAVVRLRIGTDPEKERLVLPDAVLMEDHDPPEVTIVENVETKEKEGHAEKLGKARHVRAVVGVRDREKHLVEIVGLTDPEKKLPVPAVAEALFVVEGGNGLEDGDAVKIEEPKPEKD